MGYNLHIERPDEVEITDSEWKSAIVSIRTLRLATSDVVGQNPSDGLTITIRKKDLNVELVYETKGFLDFGKRKEWIYTFNFSEGTATLSPPVDSENKEDPVINEEKEAVLLSIRNHTQRDPIVADSVSISTHVPCQSSASGAPWPAPPENQRRQRGRKGS